MKNLILASQSPRRKELLAQLGYQFQCVPANIDETQKLNESPAVYVERLALEKAQAVANKQPENSVVIGSDTCVVYKNEILGKPLSQDDCLRQLTLLSNNKHQVLTAMSVVQGPLSKSIVVSTEVAFKTLTTQEIMNYWQTGEPQDKAGSYGIQGIAGQFVTQIKGSYSAVVGLPLYETSQLLAGFSIFTPVQTQ